MRHSKPPAGAFPRACRSGVDPRAVGLWRGWAAAPVGGRLGRSCGAGSVSRVEPRRLCSVPLRQTEPGPLVGKDGAGVGGVGGRTERTRSIQGQGRSLLWRSEMAPMICPAFSNQCRSCDRLSWQHTHAAGRPAVLPQHRGHAPLVSALAMGPWETLSGDPLVQQDPAVGGVAPCGTGGALCTAGVCIVPSTEVSAMRLAPSRALLQRVPSTCSFLPSTLRFFFNRASALSISGMCQAPCVPTRK